MTILSCEHHTGMGLCQECSRAMAASVQNSNSVVERMRRLNEAAAVLEEEAKRDFISADVLNRAAVILRHRANS